MKFLRLDRFIRVSVALAFGFHVGLLSAAPTVLILPFEAQDVTLAPQASEIERASRIQPGMVNWMDTFSVTLMDHAQWETHNVGVNFLYDKPALVAKIAVDHEWAVVGRLYKPSFFFAYLQAKLVRVSNGTLRELFSVEIKGAGDKLLDKGIERLAQQIQDTIIFEATR